MKSYTREVFSWLNQVVSDPDVSASAFRVAYVMSRWFNGDRYNERGSLQCWRSQQQLAEESRLTRRGVQKCLDALSDAGHLSVEVGGKARGERSTYEALLYEKKSEERANPGSPYRIDKGEPRDRKGRTAKHLRANRRSHRNNLNNNLRNNLNNTPIGAREKLFPSMRKRDSNQRREKVHNYRFLLNWLRVPLSLTAFANFGSSIRRRSAASKPLKPFARRGSTRPPKRSSPAPGDTTRRSKRRSRIRSSGRGSPRARSDGSRAGIGGMNSLRRGPPASAGIRHRSFERWRPAMSKLPARPAQNRSPMSKALANGCRIASALSLVEEMTEARKQLGGQNERDFFGALDAAGLACASAELLAAATEQIEPMAMGLMLTMLYDAVPAAARIDVEQIVHAILALVGVEEPKNLRWSMRSRDPDVIGRDEKILELRGYSQTVVSRAIRNLLTECKFAPAPSEVLTALRDRLRMVATE